MSVATWTNLIAAIHASRRQAVVAATGGGSLAIGQLLEVPGGSRTLLEAVVPYSEPALADFLGGTPDQFCSEATARSMAMAAWMRARSLAAKTDPHNLVGVGATASLVSEVPKRGEHRIHVGVQSATQTTSYSLILTKGLRTRAEEEQIASQLLLIALGEACDGNVAEVQESFAGSLANGEHIDRRVQTAQSEWTRLLVGEASCAIGSGPNQPRPTILFPGAFNPLHPGHREMARYSAERLGNEVAFELSLTNVDKPPLDFVQIQQRLAGIASQESDRTVVLTTAPSFREKAAIMPGSTFVVGVDTLVRIADPKYYHDSSRERDQAIREITDAGCQFLIFGREFCGKFCCLSDIEIPAELRALCEEVRESEFRVDVSSTKLRNP